MAVAERAAVAENWLSDAVTFTPGTEVNVFFNVRLDDEMLLLMDSTLLVATVTVDVLVKKRLVVSVAVVALTKIVAVVELDEDT